MSLIIQSFGKTNEYRRAILTILSYYAYLSTSINNAKVILFTDQPQYFKPYLNDLPIEYVLLTQEKIKSMRGSIDFLHRMKIALIEEAFENTEGNILYADSDTFFTDDPSALMSQLSAKKSFMHVWEYRFESMRYLPLPAGKTFRAFLSLIENKTFYGADGTEIKISPEDVSWNAGVMMFHSSHARFIPDVYALTDQFYPDTLNHACEQYAFSILLQKNTEVNPCDDVIYHYWYRVKKQIVDSFLLEKLNEQWLNLSLQHKLDLAKAWTQTLPSLFKSHILTIQDNAIQAFNENKMLSGYRHSLKAFLKEPFHKAFLKDVLYHTKKNLLKR